MCANDFLKIYATQKARQQTVHTVNFNVWLLMKTRQSPRGEIEKRVKSENRPFLRNDVIYYLTTG